MMIETKEIMEDEIVQMTGDTKKKLSFWSRIVLSLAAFFLVVVIIQLPKPEEGLREFPFSPRQSPKATAGLNLPDTFDWQGTRFVKITPPLPLPRYVVETVCDITSPSVIPAEAGIQSTASDWPCGDCQALFSSASDKFILAVSKPANWDNNRTEEEVRHLLALAQPEKKPLILPDKTQANELFYNPWRFQLKVLPSFGLTFIREGDRELAYVILGKIVILSNSSAFLFQYLLNFPFL